VSRQIINTEGAAATIARRRILMAVVFVVVVVLVVAAVIFERGHVQPAGTSPAAPAAAGAARVPAPAGT
jgi:hypothetical protein